MKLAKKKKKKADPRGRIPERSGGVGKAKRGRSGR
jgi:hypothetical protein